MERSNPIYKIRRLAQAMAYHLLPHEVLSKLYYRIKLGSKPDLKDPKTLNEKMQWLKLHYYPDHPLAIQCADKYQVREYITQKGLADHLTKLLGVWERAEDIDWESLPDRFVLKCTHGCGYNIICKDKASFDRKAAAKQLNKWLRENFAEFNVEVHYTKIKPRRIIAEEYLGDQMNDYKFFCFHGQPKLLYIASDLFHHSQAQLGFFDADGRKLPLMIKGYVDIGDIEIPAFFGEMVEAARTLSADFPFVRVDFFKTDDAFTFSELTFTPSAAMIALDPKEYDAQLGALLDLSRISGR